MVILGTIVPIGEDLNDFVTFVLRRSALLHLGEIGVDGGRAAALLDSEPGLGDAWLAFVALAPEMMIGELSGGV